MNGTVTPFFISGNEVEISNAIVNGTLKAVNFDSQGATIKSAVNDSRGPVTAYWSGYEVFSGGGSSATTIDIGEFKLLSSQVVANNKISTENSLFLLVNGLVSFKDSEWTMEYNLGGDGWLQVPDAPTIAQSYPENSVRVFPWSFSVKLFGSGGIASIDRYYIKFRLKRTNIYNTPPGSIVTE